MGKSGKMAKKHDKTGKKHEITPQFAQNQMLKGFFVRKGHVIIGTMKKVYI